MLARPVVQQLLGAEQVRQVGAAVRRAALARAALLDRARVVPVLGVGDVEPARRARTAGRCARCGSASRSRTCRPRRRSRSRCPRACRRPSGSAGARPASRRRPRRSRRTSPRAPRRRRGRRARGRRTAARRSPRGARAADRGATPPCTMPKRSWPGAARRGEAAPRPAGGARHRRLDRPRRGASTGGHSSNAIAMSLPSAAWIAIARSGVSRCSLPSRCERNVTPSSSTVRRSRRLNTWKPPESVRIARGQPMKRCRPPSAATRSAPGRSAR